MKLTNKELQEQNDKLLAELAAANEQSEKLTEENESLSGEAADLKLRLGEDVESKTKELPRFGRLKKYRIKEGWERVITDLRNMEMIHPDTGEVYHEDTQYVTDDHVEQANGGRKVAGALVIPEYFELATKE